MKNNPFLHAMPIKWGETCYPEEQVQDTSKLCFLCEQNVVEAPNSVVCAPCHEEAIALDDVDEPYTEFNSWENDVLTAQTLWEADDWQGVIDHVDGMYGWKPGEIKDRSHPTLKESAEWCIKQITHGAYFIEVDEDDVPSACACSDSADCDCLPF